MCLTQIYLFTIVMLVLYIAFTIRHDAQAASFDSYSTD